MAIGLSWLVLCVFLLLYWILCNSRIFGVLFSNPCRMLLIAIAAIVTAFQGFRILFRDRRIVSGYRLDQIPTGFLVFNSPF